MLIEVRIGPGKRKLSESISSIHRLCAVPLNKIHRVPHITLYGSFAADHMQVERVKDAIVSVGKRYSSLPYLLDGFRWINGKQGKVIFFNVVAPAEFTRFRHELAQRLLKIAPKTQPFDKEEDFIFHSTLAYKLESREFESIWSYVSGDKVLAEKFSSTKTDGENYHMRFFHLPLNALRVTLLNDQSKLICEYDFLQQRLLSRAEALNVNEWGRTLKLFRMAKGIEGDGLIDRQGPPYLISDLHLGHANIIQYCARPFVSANVKEMDDILMDNWNNSVGGNDVFFLGDLYSGSRPKSVEHWPNGLTGKIHFIRGDNDPDVPGSSEYEVLKQGRYTFLLTHNPDRLPIPWNGWIIHGHKHNNDMKNFPFINGDRKTINVCPELINYRPVSLNYLTSLKLSSIKRMDTIDSTPVMR